MANLFNMARLAAQFSESRGAFEREARRKEEVKKAAKNQLMESQRATSTMARELTPEQQRRLRITQAFNRAYIRPTLAVQTPPRQQVERTVAFLKAIDRARASRRLQKLGLRTIFER